MTPRLISCGRWSHFYHRRSATGNRCRRHDEESRWNGSLCLGRRCKEFFGGSAPAGVVEVHGEQGDHEAGEVTRCAPSEPNDSQLERDGNRCGVLRALCAGRSGGQPKPSCWSAGFTPSLKAYLSLLRPSLSAPCISHRRCRRFSRNTLRSRLTISDRFFDLAEEGYDFDPHRARTASRPRVTPLRRSIVWSAPRRNTSKGTADAARPRPTSRLRTLIRISSRRRGDRCTNSRKSPAERRRSPLAIRTRRPRNFAITHVHRGGGPPIRKSATGIDAIRSVRA